MKRIGIVVGILTGVVVAILAVVFLLGGGDPAERVSADTPAMAPLSIPPLLEPTLENGVSRYTLTIGRSRHDYKQARITDTYSYNGMSVLGPTLRLRSGASVVISVTNELDEVTTTHWHGADVPAEDDGGPHSTIAPGTTWVADFDVIQPAATLWYHPHAHGSTAEHVYRGAAGLIIIEDDNPAAAALPATYGVDDIPVIIQDRDFTDDGQLDLAGCWSSARTDQRQAQVRFRTGSPPSSESPSRRSRSTGASTWRTRATSGSSAQPGQSTEDSST